jgi:hypothetical protein
MNLIQDIEVGKARHGRSCDWAIGQTDPAASTLEPLDWSAAPYPAILPSNHTRYS